MSAHDSPPTDAELLASHVSGDPDAFAELVKRHQDRLWSVALRTTGDREEAADALQDALISAFRNAEKYRGEAKVTSWLHRIVINACLDRLRRRRRTVRLSEQDEGQLVAVGDAMAQADTAMVLQDGLMMLPSDQRAALVLVDIEGYPVAEAAVLLKVAVGTVKSRCARGRAKLAQLIAPLAGNPPPNSDVQPLVGPSHPQGHRTEQLEELT